MGVARAWSRWPTEIFSPSLMHTVNLYLSNVGSKMAISIMVLKIELPPNCTFSITLSIYLSMYVSIYLLPLTFMRVYIGAGKASFLSIRILSRLLPRVVGIC